MQEAIEAQAEFDPEKGQNLSQRKKRSSLINLIKLNNGWLLIKRMFLGSRVPISYLNSGWMRAMKVNVRSFRVSRNGILNQKIDR